MKPEMEKREFLKGYSEEIVKEFADEKGVRSPQKRGLPVPPMQKECLEETRFIDLIDPDDITIGNAPLFDIIRQRQSRRRFTYEPLTLEELSFLLYSTQGVRRLIKDKDGNPRSSLRTSPSGGARHPFETYLFINRVTGIESGLYRYLPLDNKIVFLYQNKSLSGNISEGCCDQTFVGTGAVVFIWTAIPYRMEWRYGIFSHKIIAQDSGHLCQNLYLAAEAIGGGACAIGAYIQEKMDAILKVDGKDEFTIYVAPVGKVEKTKAVKVNPEVLKSYIGKYAPESKPDQFLFIAYQKGKLLLVTRESSRFELTPVSDTCFHLDIAGVEITFELEETSEPTGFVLNQAGDEKFMKKIVNE